MPVGPRVKFTFGREIKIITPTPATLRANRILLKSEYSRESLDLRFPDVLMTSTNRGVEPNPPPSGVLRGDCAPVATTPTPASRWRGAVMVPADHRGDGLGG